MTTRSTELLRAVHRHPGITRADAARLIGIGTGAATELVTKLSRSALLTQAPAAPSGTRGRPTTVLLPHPDGPLVLALALTNEAWRLDVVELGGATVTSISERHEHAPWTEVRDAVAAAVKHLQSRYGPRLRALGISVPGPVPHDFGPTPVRQPTSATPHHRPTSGPPSNLRPASSPPANLRPASSPPADRLYQGAEPGSLRLNAFTSDWHAIDLTGLWPEADLLVAGNDATLAATAEHPRGATASVALHLHIESGLGGALIENGRPVIGARNTAGEFGHMPFGDPKIKCTCGANGCWGTSIDGTALARLLNAPPPRDPVTYARRVIATATTYAAAEPAVTVAGATSAAPSSYSSGKIGPDIDPEAAFKAVEAVGTALGRGIAGLVNALDPDVVTLGGIGPDLLAATPSTITTAYRAGLMMIHRDSPPPIRPATLPDDEGPIAGAAEEAWTALLPRLA